MMPKKRALEKEDSTQKRLRQSTLPFHFESTDRGAKGSGRGEEEQEEQEEDPEMSRVLSPEEEAEAKRRRDLMASAAERRKQADSPWKTPPHDPEDSQQEGSQPDLGPTPPTNSSPATKTPPPHPHLAPPLSPPVALPSHAQSPMVTALAPADGATAQIRTRSKVAANSPSKIAHHRTDGDVGDRQSGTRDVMSEQPSTSRRGESREVGRGGVEFLDEEEDDDDLARITGGAVDPLRDTTSPTLEYNYDGDGSQPLFTDSEPMEEQEGDDTKDETSTYWKGVPISDLNRAPSCLETLPEMRPAKDHTILFSPQTRTTVPPRPFPDDYQDVWDSNHVRMPCSPENLYPVEDQTGRKKVQSRWELIESTLLGGIRNSVDLEEAILTYNARYSQRWNFRALHTLFTEVLDGDETVFFFDKVLPEMVSLALRLPKLCTQAIPLLRRQRGHSVTLSQLQVASLLANAFFCTFPRRNAQQKKSEYSRFPDINFNRLFEMGKGYKNHRKIEKLKCILNYFRRVTSKEPTGSVTISRRCLPRWPRWDKSSTPLPQLHMAASGTIEREGHGMLQVDFANKYLGGGVLGFGCVQEEIRFMVCPELLITRLITEVLDDNECIVVKGAEQFSDYSGYANSFKWRGNFNDSTPWDSWGRRETEIVAIDALVIRQYENQFRLDCLRRELNKAFCGFYCRNSSPEHLPAIATGNWGCGAFGGETRLKALLQLMAAAEAGRNVAYFTFGDKDLCDDMAAMHEFLTAQAVTVGDLWGNLQRYWSNVMRRGAGSSKPKLFAYLYQLYTTCDSDTDEYEGADGPGEQEEGKVLDGGLSPNYRADTP